MRRALALARTRAGSTWPNPTVGAVIVAGGRIVAQGVHQGPGQPHAEADAIAGLPAGIDPSEATIYVTLEPCHHRGRTPPCSRAIAEAGIGHVVYAVDDSNPTVPGGGGEWLRERGIEVVRGPLAGLAWELNHAFFETEGGGQPHVTLKLALSADGRLARRLGRVDPQTERQITGRVAHRRVHHLRAAASAVLVGRRTVDFDHPRLTARLASAPPVRQPRPVVLDTHLTAEPTAYPENALVLTGETAAEVPRDDLELCQIEIDGEHLSWASIFGALETRSLGALLVEGGAVVAETLLEQAPPHRIHLFLAPEILGGDGPRFEPREALEGRYTTYRTRRVGRDVEWILRRRDLPDPPSDSRNK